MKNIKRWFLLPLLLALPLLSAAQKAEKYPFPASYNKEAAQGMAIYKSSAFLLNNGGHCRIYDLKSEKLVADFDLACAVYKENHCNNASFGVDFPAGNKEFPAFYVAECYGERRCFVESVTRSGSQLIQVLKIDAEGRIGFDWVVDRNQKCLYALSKISDVIDSIGTKKYLITKYPLPTLDKKEVVFTKKDLIEEFEIGFPNLSQGASIHKGHLYLPVGLHSSPTTEKRKDAHRDIIVVNLKTHRIEKIIDIQSVVDGEPEDIDFYRNNLLLYCGQQDGGVYNLKRIYEY
ncbi:MAG: hypothetical protein LBU22_04905 [Dysgonamonadaceae bacterium]|nr:hypothetical protein [Dysgonamonadaceae bacterium]